METFQVQDLTFYYPGEARPALSEVSLTVERGEFLALCGPSGGGKTTLLRLLKPAVAPHGRRSGAADARNGSAGRNAGRQRPLHRRSGGADGELLPQRQRQRELDAVRG